MINIILTGHNNFATGLLSSIKLIAGDVKNLTAIDFLEGDTPKDIKKKYADVIENNEGDFIFLTDLVGGTPFKEACSISLSYDKKIYVVAGTNLGMVLEVAFNEKDNDILDFAIKSGKNNIQCFNPSNIGENDVAEDGI